MQLGGMRSYAVKELYNSRHAVNWLRACSVTELHRCYAVAQRRGHAVKQLYSTRLSLELMTHLLSYEPTRLCCGYYADARVIQ